MKTKTTLFISIFVLLSLFAQTIFAASWPTQSTGTTISGGLPSGYEPSGAVWHPRLNALFVVSDDNIVSRMNIDGTDVTSWTLTGDLEGLAIADSSSNYVYVLNEYPYAIYEFDFSTGTRTKSWSLTGIVPAPVISTSYGLEGMTYISSEGLFAVGSQETGTIYFLSVDTSVSGGSVSLVRSMKPVSASISDMYFDPETETLYVLYDATLVEMDTSGTIIASYTVPGTDQEAVTLATACPATTSTIVIGSDRSHTFTSYTRYPVTCPSEPTPEPTPEPEPTPVDLDTDDDGLLDTEEAIYGTDPTLADTDADGLTDYQEIMMYGTNALSSDSDSGSVSDAEELSNGTNPLDGTDDVIVDQNLITSYTIDNTNALVTVYYADGHSNVVNPFPGTDSILVGLNYDNTVLVVTNGKRMKTFQNGAQKDSEYISKYTPSAMTLTITHGSSSDVVALQYTVRRGTSTTMFVLSGTNLART